jgi:hypothetical protein
MKNEVRELNETELEGVAGGMSCRTAIAIARTYYTAGLALEGLGNTGGANNFYGFGSGVLTASCPQ